MSKRQFHDPVLEDQKLRSLRLLLVVQLTFWLRLGIIEPILALFLRGTGITVTEIGLLVMVQSLGWAIFEPIFGVLTDMVGKKRLIIYSIVGTSVIYVSYPFATMTWHFYLIMFAMSSNMAAGAVSTRAMIIEFLPVSGRGKVYGRYMAIATMGEAAGPILGGFLADAVGYHAPFYVSGGIGVISLLAALPMKYGSNKIKRTSTMKTPDLGRLITGSFLGLLLLRLIFMFNWNFQTSNLPIILHEGQGFGVSDTQIGFYMGTIRFTSAVSQLFLGDLVDRIGVKRVITAGLGLSGFSYLSLLFYNGIPYLYLLGAFQGILFAASDMSMMIYLMDIIPKDGSGRAMGAYGFSEDIGGMIASPSLGFVYDHFGTLSPIVLVSTMLTLNAALSIPIIKKRTTKTE